MLPKVRASTPGQFLDWGFKVIDTLGIHQTLQGDDISTLLDTKMEFSNPSENDGSFADKAQIKLSPLEALSLAYIGVYYAQIANEYSYYIGFEMEDSYKKQSEQMISDGLLMQYDGDTQESIFPFQETKAIGMFKRDTRNIEDVIIESINKKLARRSSYPDTCGLLVSILCPHSNIGYKRIVDACDISVFDKAFAMEYVDNNLRTCAVLDLTELKANPGGKLNVPIISPNLRYPKS